MRIILGLMLVVLLSGWAPAQQSAAVNDQAAALLPEFRSDLDRAGEWNRYSISATIDPIHPSISGRLVLEYTNRDSVALDRLYFRLFPNLADFAGHLDVSALAVGGQQRKIVYEQKRYLLRVDLPKPLRPGEASTITIDFRTSAPANAGRTFYGAFNLQNSVLALASSYPLVAMVQGGVWDIGVPDTRGDLVNSETALYSVTLTAPADWTLVTTGSAVDGRLDAGRQTARFVSGPQRDFMIVATRLKAVTGDANGTKINAFYLPGNEAGGQAALRAAINAMQVYNAHFGRYPFAEFDLVPVDAGTFLGVEYPGITLIEQRLYRKPAELEVVIAHEVAHQWWYSLVGNNVQTHAWMDEALATYSQVIYAEQISGREAANVQLDQFRKSYRTARTAGRDTIVEQANQRIRNYYPIVYAKGALFFQALRNQVGDADFERFLKTYYADHRYGFVNRADMIGSAEQACGCELDQLARDWIETAAPVAIP